jgi:hypothetical protein
VGRRPLDANEGFCPVIRAEAMRLAGVHAAVIAGLGVTVGSPGTPRTTAAGPSWAASDDPGIGEGDIGQPAGTGEGHPAAEYLGVEAPGTLDVVRDDEVG